MNRKKENQQLLEEEMSTIKAAKVAAPSKLTRAEIERNQEIIAAQGREGYSIGVQSKRRQSETSTKKIVITKTSTPKRRQVLS